MSPPPQSHVDPALQMLATFDDTLGALLVGSLVATALWGMTCVQTFTFFTRRSTRRDNLFLKPMITFLWLLDTLNSVLDGHIMYHSVITDYLNPTAISTRLWSAVLCVTITSLSDFLIRTMFAHGIYRLSSNLLITAWIMVLSTINLVVGIVATDRGFRVPSLSGISNLLYLSLASSIASDLSVTLALSWLLARSRTGIPSTNTLINTLMLYTVNTGLIVNIDVIICMITYVVLPKDNFIFLAFYLLESKLYLNSYLAMLNARDDLREMANEPSSLHLASISALQSRSNGIIEDSPLEKGSGSQMMGTTDNTYAEGNEDGPCAPSTSSSTNPV